MDEIRDFLSDLAVRRRVSASTQRQAFSALLFLYRGALRLPLIEKVERARKPRRLPVVLTRAEVHAVLAELSGTLWLVAGLLYGSRLRLLEALRLRVKDLDFAATTVHVRAGKARRTGSRFCPRG